MGNSASNLICNKPRHNPEPQRKSKQQVQSSRRLTAKKLGKKKGDLLKLMISETLIQETYLRVSVIFTKLLN
jgi:hypothetical protein